jgi:hypothetical protein
MNRSVRDTIARHARNDEGSLSKLTLGIVPVMFLAGGMAVDHAIRRRAVATISRTPEARSTPSRSTKR